MGSLILKLKEDLRKSRGIRLLGMAGRSFGYRVVLAENAARTAPLKEDGPASGGAGYHGFFSVMEFIKIYERYVLASAKPRRNCAVYSAASGAQVATFVRVVHANDSTLI
jgi:hypothetical protein